jgi:endothelin-converting enzyme/putative endopeptidase
MDDAPNYGNTGSTIGHELTHGFDDEGRQFDPIGNLRDWWSKEDAAEFNQRTACIVDQYSQYTVVDDLKINGRLTLGEDVADLGGTVLAYVAWKAATAGQESELLNGFTPEQRFFIGAAQWACSNVRPETLRLRALTDSHSPTHHRVNGVMSNLPEFAQAFSCKSGQPMVREKPCKVW